MVRLPISKGVLLCLYGLPGGKLHGAGISQLLWHTPPPALLSAVSSPRLLSTKPRLVQQPVEMHTADRALPNICNFDFFFLCAALRIYMFLCCVIFVDLFLWLSFDSSLSITLTNCKVLSHGLAYFKDGKRLNKHFKKNTHTSNGKKSF